MHRGRGSQALSCSCTLFGGGSGAGGGERERQLVVGALHLGQNGWTKAAGSAAASNWFCVSV